MKNNLFKISILFVSFFFIQSFSYADDFNFDVTEIEILNNGKIFKGLKRGEIRTNEGIILIADQFEYNKDTNILTAQGNVDITDQINNYHITSNSIIYLKNKNIIYTSGNSKAESVNDNVKIEADNFEYHKLKNKIIAENNAIIEDKINKNKIFAEKILYFKNQEKITTFGKTRALVNKRYDFNSENIARANSVHIGIYGSVKYSFISRLINLFS